MAINYCEPGDSRMQANEELTRDEPRATGSKVYLVSVAAVWLLIGQKRFSEKQSNDSNRLKDLKFLASFSLFEKVY